MKHLFSLAIALMLGQSPASAAEPDPLVATSVIDPSAVSPLRHVALYVRDGALSGRFLVSAMAMREGRRRALSAADAKRLGLPRGVVATHYSRLSLPGAAHVRVYASLATPTALRPTHAAAMAGGLAVGMPVLDQAARERLVATAGFGSVVGATSMTLPRGDGTTYTVGEIHYRAPEGVLVLGIDRGTMRPVGPIDPATGIGGPAYASIVVNDLAGTERFMRDVLRFEKRREAVFASAGPKGGLGLPDGQRFAFQQWFAPGTSTGYIILMKMLDRVPVAVAGGFSNAGIVMVGFDADDLKAVHERARAAGARVVAAPSSARESLILAMPDGFLVEIAPRRSDGG